jgi:hypothetical protein
MMLNKRERNKIYEEIVGKGHDPAEFNLEDTGSKVVIGHNSGSTFEFFMPRSLFERIQADRYKYRYEYRANVAEGVNQAGGADSMSSLEQSISYWLDEIRQTVGVPDFWAEMRRSREFAVDIQRVDTRNTPFTQDERRQIAAQLEAIKEQVKEQFDLTREQITHIEEWRNEAAEASEHFGRKDWRILVYGTIVNLFVTDALPPEVARHILAMFIHVIADLFLGGGGPPQILT